MLLRSDNGKPLSLYYNFSIASFIILLIPSFVNIYDAYEKDKKLTSAEGDEIRRKINKRTDSHLM